MLVRFCLFFLAGGLSGLKAQNTASVQLNVRLEPIQILSVQNGTEKEIPQLNNLQITSTYGYTVRLHRERMQSEKKHRNASETSAVVTATTETDGYKVVSTNAGTQQSIHAISIEKYQKTPSKAFSSGEVPHYVYTIISH